MNIEYSIPARGLMGYRSTFMTATRGEGIINSVYNGYEPYKGDITLRWTGSLVASETGETTSYGLYNTQERGNMFIGPATPVYEGMIVGESPKVGGYCASTHARRSTSPQSVRPVRMKR